MKVKFYAPEREYIAFRKEFDETFSKGMLGGRYLQSEEVSSLEEEVAQRVGRKYAIAVGSCSDALYFVFEALDSGGECFAVPSMTFVATANAVLRAEALPLPVDVKENFLLDLDAVDRLRSHGKMSVRQLVYVGLFGTLDYLTSVEKFTQPRSMVVVEDAAQSFGASDGQKKSGTLGVASCLSFDPTKPLSAPGSGGMVLTDDEGLVREIRKLRYHGKEDGEFVDIGCNSQMSTLTAATLRIKLKYYDEFLAMRNAVANRYCQALGAVVEAPRKPVDHVWSWSKFVIKTDRRDELREYLSTQGIETLVHYPKPLNQYRQFSFWRQPTPVADGLSKRCLSLPIYPFMTDEEIDYVVFSILMFFDKEK